MSERGSPDGKRKLWVGRGERCFVRGGRGAMCAYVEARKIHPEENDFLVVSLGTGEPTREMPYEGYRRRRASKPALNTLGSGL